MIETETQAPGADRLGETPDAARQPAPIRQLGAELLGTVRDGRSTAELRVRLEGLTLPELAAGLPSDPARKAFWINLYNAWVQLILRNDPARYDRRGAFFERRLIPIAGARISLDTIEHGILRRSQWRAGLGYVQDPFPRRFELTLRVDRRDWRIHFALNCGARSCPQIAVYGMGSIDEHLDEAARRYLSRTVTFDPEADLVRVPRLMRWFLGDFGGPAGILRILAQFDLIPERSRPRIAFDSFDWAPEVGAFT